MTAATPQGRAATAGRTAGGQGSMSKPPGLFLIFNPGYTALTFLSALPAFFLKSFTSL
jgi:hypothetical protein